MPDGTYNTGLEELNVDSWEDADIRVLLLADDTLDFDRTHATVSELLAAAGNTEASGPGYERKTVPARTVTRNDTDDRAELDHDDIVWTDIDAGTVGAIIYFRHVTDDTDSVVWFFKDSGFPFATNGSDLVRRTPSGGLVQVEDAA